MGRTGTKARRLYGLLLCGLWAGSSAAASGRAERLFLTEPLPPYTFEQAGRAAGPMVDILQAACERLAWRCRVEVMPWRRALRELQNGRADGIFALLGTPERRLAMHVTVPVVGGRYALFARAGQAYVYEGAASLGQRQIGVYGPSGSSISLTELLQGRPAQMVVEPDNLTVLRKLTAGRYGADGLAFVNEGVALFLLREQGLAGVQLAGVVKQFNYSFGLSRQRFGAAELRAFDATLSALCREGLTAELVKPFALPAAPCGALLPVR